MYVYFFEQKTSKNIVYFFNFYLYRVAYMEMYDNTLLRLVQ